MNSELQALLNTALKEYEPEKYPFVQDFDTKNVIYSCDGGYKLRSYSVSGGKVELGEDATTVRRKESYVPVSLTNYVTSADLVVSLARGAGQARDGRTKRFIPMGGRGSAGSGGSGIGQATDPATTSKKTTIPRGEGMRPGTTNNYLKNRQTTVKQPSIASRYKRQNAQLKAAKRPGGVDIGHGNTLHAGGVVKNSKGEAIGTAKRTRIQGIETISQSGGKKTGRYKYTKSYRSSSRALKKGT